MLTALKRILKMCGHAFTLTVHERLDTIEQRGAETDNALLQASLRIAERMQTGAAHKIVDIAADGPPISAWIRLIAHLYSYVPSRKAAISGFSSAERDGLRGALEKAGYETVICDSAQIAGNTGVLISDSAERLKLAFSVAQPPIVVTAVSDALEPLVPEMHSRGYHWYLVVHGGEGAAAGAGSFYANHAVLGPGAAAHVLFFLDRDTFVEAQEWCAALLRRTYFRYPSA